MERYVTFICPRFTAYAILGPNNTNLSYSGAYCLLGDPLFYTCIGANGPGCREHKGYESMGCESGQVLDQTEETLRFQLMPNVYKSSLAVTPSTHLQYCAGHTALITFMHLVWLCLQVRIFWKKLVSLAYGTLPLLQLCSHFLFPAPLTPLPPSLLYLLALFIFSAAHFYSYHLKCLEKSPS